MNNKNDLNFLKNYKKNYSIPKTQVYNVCDSENAA